MQITAAQNKWLLSLAPIWLLTISSFLVGPLNQAATCAALIGRHGEAPHNASAGAMSTRLPSEEEAQTINTSEEELKLIDRIARKWSDGNHLVRSTRRANNEMDGNWRHHQGQQREHIHYKTTYACEGSKLELSCQDGKLIHLVRANYGRFSLGICNELGLSNLSVQCFSFRAFLPMEARCNKHSNCSVIVSKELFGDPCEGTSKYLEVQYYCDDANNNNNNQQQQQQPASPSNRVSQQTDGQKEQAGAPTGHKSQASQVGGSQAEARDEQPQQQPQQNPSINDQQQPLGTISVIQQQQQQQFCMPQTSVRNLYWNYTLAGSVARQSCPNGSSGKVAWLCDSERLRFTPSWSPDFSQCRSNWLQRLAHQLDQMLESGSGKQQSVEWQRQQTEQMLKLILNDLALMARTKELFSEDLKRIDIMVSQIISQLRSLLVLTGAGTNWQSDVHSLAGSGANNLAPMHEELFNKLVAIVSSLFDVAQRAAWLEIQPQEARRKLEQRYLNHLRDSGVLLANSMGPAGLGQLQPVRQANVFAGITVIDGGRLNSPTAPIDPESNEFNLQLRQSQSLLGRFLAEPLDGGDQINEFRIHLSILRELVANGITRFLVLDIKKPDYSLIRHQLEWQSAAATYANGSSASIGDPSAMDNNHLPSDQQWSSRVFGVFDILGENGDVLDGNANNQQDNKLSDLLAQWPISVDFKVSPPPVTTAQVASSTANRLQVPLRQCNSLNDDAQQPNRCQTIRSNATNHICRCDQFGFVALTTTQQDQQQVPNTNQMADSFPWPSVQPSPTDFELPAGGSLLAGFGSQRNAGGPMGLPAYVGPQDKSSHQQTLSVWTIIFIVLGLSVFIVSLATFVIRIFVRASSQARLSKKPGFLSTGTSILGHHHHHHHPGSGPTTGPLADHSLMSGEPLATASAATTNASQSSAAPIIGLSTSTSCHAYKTHQQLYAAHYPSIDGCVMGPSKWTAWTRWLRPSRWLSAASPSLGTKDHHLGVQHRIVGSTLANAHSAAYKSHFQNGYTTSLHHQSPIVPPSNLPLAAPSSASSYVSSSAYYEEIGPGNLTKVNTNQQLSNTHTIVDPFKRQPDQQHLLTSGHLQQRPQQQAWSYHAQEPVQHQLANNYGPIISGNSQQQQHNNKQLSLHNDLSQLQQAAAAPSQSSSSSAGSQHSASTNVTTANGSSPRHYLFASPSAYKQSSTMTQHTLYQQQHHLGQLQQPQQHQQFQQRFMPSG